MYSKQKDALVLAQAARQSTTLQSLQSRARDSQHRLQSVQALFPPALAPLLRAGSFEDGVWHLLAPHSAAASKLRQLQNQLLAHLNKNDLPTREIAIKIMT